MKNFIKYGVLLLIATALTPLFVVEPFLYPAVTAKMFFFTGAVLLALALIGIGITKGEQLYLSRLKRPLVWIPAILLVATYTSSLFGIDFYHSFWSVFNRGAGLLYGLTLPIVAFYLALITFTKKDGEKFLKLVAIVSTIVAVYAFIQWCATALHIHIPFIMDTRGSRIGGTLGNAAFLASYLGMTIWITAYVREKVGSRMRGWASASIGFQLLVIFLTATRGTFLALGVMVFLFVLYLALRGSDAIKKKARIFTGALIVLAILGFLFKEQIMQIPFAPIERIANISIEDATVANRLFVWNGALNSLSSIWFMGVGAENIETVFNTFYDPGLITEEWFDRSHNIYIDYILQYGIIGLLVFLALLVAYGMSIHKSEYGGREKILFFIALGVYVLQNAFVFDTVSTFALMLFLFMLCLMKEGDTPRTLSSSVSLSGYGVALVAVVLLVPTVILPASANLALSEAYTYHVTDVPRAVKAVEGGLALNTFADLEYGYQLYDMYTKRQQHLLDPVEKKKAYDIAYKVLKANSLKYSYDARTFTYLAHVMETRPTTVPLDEEEYSNVLKQAIGLSPKRPQGWYLTANTFLRVGDASTGKARTDAYNKAIDIFIDYTELVPEYAEPHFILANLYRSVGDTAKADISFKEGEARYKGELEDARRATGYLIAKGDYVGVLPYIEDLTEGQPTKENKYDLAKIRFLNNDFDGAVTLVNEVYVIDPQYLASDQTFLSQFIATYKSQGSTIPLLFSL